MKPWAKQKGFTIVELLIVIVVIGILASITIVAYNGIQQRGRDAQRKSDVATIAKAIELYYTDKGTLPTSSCTLGAGCKINYAWSTTSDGSWSNLEAQLVPKYISSLPKDPLASTATNPSIYGGYNYDYAVITDTWCNASVSRPAYIFEYRLEASGQKREIVGDCLSSSPQPTDYDSTEYFVIK